MSGTKIQAEDYAVERDCCTSGNCLYCERKPLGERMRVIQVDNVSKDRAEMIARNFAAYNATVIKPAATK